MDYLPRPGDPLPGIDVPLLDILPVNSRPKHVRPCSVSDKKQQYGPALEGECIAISNSQASYKIEGWKGGSTSWGVEYLIPYSNANQPDHGHNTSHFTREASSDHEKHVGSENHQTFAGRQHLLDRWLRFPETFDLSQVGHDGKLCAGQSPLRLAGLMQSWAFFGLLELLFGEMMNSKEWARRGDPSGKEILVQWPRRFIVRLEKVTAQTAPQHIQTAVRAVRRVCSSIEGSDAAMVTPLAQILLSIHVLCETLYNDPAGHVLHKSAYLAEQMQHRGWCPSITSRAIASSHKGVTLAYYLFTLRSERNNRSSHAQCSSQRCMAGNTTLDATYRTRHVSQRCHCQDLAVDTAELSSMIARGRVPLVEILDSNDGLTLTIKEGKPGDEYTAISHVWSDGLGNPSSNALPTCQIANLLRLIRRLPQGDVESLHEGYGVATLVPGFYKLDRGTGQLINVINRPRGSVLLWMDTLCIPVSRSDEGHSVAAELKLKAINHMNFIFARANRVMVVDQELLNIRLQAASMLELYARIVSSPWLQRSWTYQEGALAILCHFEFADVSVCPTLLSDSNPSRVHLGRYLQNLIGGTDFTSQYRSAHAKPIYEKFKSFCIRLLSEVGRNDEWHQTKPNDNADTVNGFDSSPLAIQLRTVLNSVIMRALNLPLTHHNNGHPARDRGLQRVSTAARANDRLEQLVSVWNELCFRTSTQAEDLDLIFANMLDYNPTKLPGNGKAHHQRLQAILWHMELLPLQMLYNVGSRLDSNRHHRNRWVPTEPSSAAIDDSYGPDHRPYISGSHGYIERMRFHAGALWIQAESAPISLLLIVNIQVPRCPIVYIESKNAANTYLKVIADTSASDRFDHRRYGHMCLLLGVEHIQTSSRGARLYTSSQSPSVGSTATYPWEGMHQHCLVPREPLRENNFHLSAVYDCPITATSVHQSQMPADAILVRSCDCTWLSYPDVAWKLKIECDDFKEFQPQIPRPKLQGPASYKRLQGYYGIIPLLFGLVVIFVVWPLRIVIAVQLGWKDTSAIYKASTIVSGCFPIWPLPEALFAASRVAENTARPIDIAWIVISMIAHPMAYFGFTLSFNLGMALPYNAWLRTFDDDWPASRKSWQHTLTFGLLDRLP